MNADRYCSGYLKEGMSPEISVPLADIDGDGCVCDEYGPAFCDWGGDHIEEGRPPNG